MDSHIADGLIFYLGLVVLLTFHEFAPRVDGVEMRRRHGAAARAAFRSIPSSHIDPIGTVLLPLLMIFALAGRRADFLIGWAKPVPFNPANLRNRWRDEMLIAMAGPAMNIILAVALVAFARVAVMFGSDDATELFLQMARIESAALFFQPDSDSAAGWFARFAEFDRHDL